MDSTTVARSMRGSIGMLAMAWLMADETRAQAAARGMGEGMGAYAIGRLAGEWNADFFGWPKPYPDVSALADQREQIEATTDMLHARDFEILTDDERAELRVLAKAARAFAS